ncbi:MAG: TIGR01459 family HAD-type hydrolase, partial [Alphaproteobacteria bacterium]
LYTGLIYGGPALVKPLVKAVSKPSKTIKVDGLNDAIQQGGIKGLIVDLWGVMHNGKALFPDAVKALESVRAKGVKVQFLSNAPRRAPEIYKMLDGMGLDRALYDGIVSSGEAAWQAMKDRSDPFYAALGSVCYHLGAGEKDHNMREGQDFTFQDELAYADWILNTGPADASDMTQWIPLLKTALTAKLPMVCANPDRVVMRGENKELCAGSLAEWYEEQGGSVMWHGKPFASVYKTARNAMGLKRHEVLGIGDSFTTDVAGALTAGIQVLLVNTGIHQNDLDADLMKGVDRLSDEKGIRPTFVDDRLKP